MPDLKQLTETARSRRSEALSQGRQRSGHSLRNRQQSLDCGPCSEGEAAALLPPAAGNSGLVSVSPFSGKPRPQLAWRPDTTRLVFSEDSAKGARDSTQATAKQGAQAGPVIQTTSRPEGRFFPPLPLRAGKAEPGTEPVRLLALSLQGLLADADEPALLPLPKPGSARSHLLAQVR